MIKVSVIKNNEVVQFVRFDSKEEADFWINQVNSSKCWGTPDESRIIEEQKVIHHPAIPAILGDVMELTAPAKIVNGIEIDPPLYTLNPQGTIVPEVPAWDEYIPAVYGIVSGEYTVEIEDITEKVEQEKINNEAKAYLASTDWLVIRMADSGIPVPNEIQVLRQQARDRIL